MGYRQRPFRTTASKLITGEVEDGSRHNPFANEVAQFEVGRQQLLGLGVDLSLGVIGDGRRVEEVEEAVVLDGLGVSEGLEDGVGLQQLLLQFTLCKNTKINIRAAFTNVANRQKCNETYLPVNYTSLNDKSRQKLGN